MRRSDEQRANWDQVRHAIDTGATGEKVGAADPAAAPLGTDAEAGGHPAQPAPEIAPGQLTPLGNTPTTAAAGTPSRTRTYLWAGLAVVVILAVVLGVM